MTKRRPRINLTHQPTAHSGDMDIRIQDLDIGIRFDVTGPEISSRLDSLQIKRLGPINVQLQRYLFQVHKDISDILPHTLNRRELM